MIFELEFADLEHSIAKMNKMEKFGKKLGFEEVHMDMCSFGLHVAMSKKVEGSNEKVYLCCYLPFSREAFSWPVSVGRDVYSCVSLKVFKNFIDGVIKENNLTIDTQKGISTSKRNIALLDYIKCPQIPVFDKNCEEDSGVFFCEDIDDRKVYGIFVLDEDFVIAGYAESTVLIESKKIGETKMKARRGKTKKEGIVMEEKTKNTPEVAVEKENNKKAKTRKPRRTKEQMLQAKVEEYTNFLEDNGYSVSKSEVEVDFVNEDQTVPDKLRTMRDALVEIAQTMQKLEEEYEAPKGITEEDLEEVWGIMVDKVMGSTRTWKPGSFEK